MTNIQLDKFLNSPKLAGSIFLMTGANKTYNDYKNADKKYKNKFLIKDSAILAGAGLGMILQKKYTPRVSEIKPLKNIVDKMSLKFAQTKFAKKYQKPVDYGREIMTDTLKNASMFASGIIGALTVDIISSQIKGLQPEPINNISSQTELDAEINTMQKFLDKEVDKVIINKDIKNAMYNRITDMPQLGILTSSIAGANAIDLAKETELKTKLQHTGNCIINNSMLPMLYLSIANVLTKNLKSYERIIGIFGILVTGTLITSKLTEMKMKYLSEQNLNKYINKLNFLSKLHENKTFSQLNLTLK